MANETYYIGVDVGTGSVRAGVFDAKGKMLADKSQDIDIFYPQKDFVEQSSTDIWQKACAMVKDAVAESGIDPARVAGIGFDATCSLVALDDKDEPVSISPTGENNQNIIVWMDHRAIEQAERINKTGAKVLDYVGGKISPEMEIPKILWLKRNQLRKL